MLLWVWLGAVQVIGGVVAVEVFLGQLGCYSGFKTEMCNDFG